MTMLQTNAGKRADGVSQYVRLAGLLRHRIASGVYPVGRQLPTITHLAKELGMAVVSVRQAYGQLIDEGLIQVQRGKGTHVRALPPMAELDTIQAIGQPFHDTDGVRFNLKGISHDLALPLELGAENAANDQYAWIRKVHVQNGIPFCYAEVYVRQADFLQFPADLAERSKILPAILGLLGDHCQTIRQRTTVHPADFPLCEMLDVPFGSPVAKMVRRLLSVDQAVLYASEVWYRGDHFLTETEFSVADFWSHPGLSEPRQLRETEKNPGERP